MTYSAYLALTVTLDCILLLPLSRKSETARPAAAPVSVLPVSRGAIATMMKVCMLRSTHEAVHRPGPQHSSPFPSDQYLLGSLLAIPGDHAFRPPTRLLQPRTSASARLRMVAMPEARPGTKLTEKKLDKINNLKIESNALREPISSEMGNDEVFVSHVSCPKADGPQCTHDSFHPQTQLPFLLPTPLPGRLSNTQVPWIVSAR